jgi:hypothetical protein
MRQSVLGLLLLAAACGSSQRSMTAPTSVPAAGTTAQTVLARWKSGQPIRVVVLGNSISEGFYADGWERLQLTPDMRLTPASEADDSVPSVITQLRRFVRSKNPSSVVVNTSGAGYTAARTLAGLDQALDGKAYDLAFLPLEVNDANQGNTPAEMAITLQHIIDRLAAAKIVPVLVKENDIYGLPESRFGIPFSEFMAAVDQLAAQNHLSVVDGYTPFHAAVVAGGGVESCGLFFVEQYQLHPNQAGHDLLFRTYQQWFGS